MTTRASLSLGISLAIVVSAAALVVIPRSQNRVEPVGAAVLKNRDGRLALLSQDKSLVSFGRWATNESSQIDLSYLVTEFDQDPNYEGKGVRLSIFNRSGETVYEDYFTNISRIYSDNLLRTAEIPQLVLEVNFGGNADFLQVLAYRNGKISNLATKLDFFNSHAEVRPQFRSAVDPAKEPYEIFLTNPGLAGAGKKETTVYRFEDGSFRPVGQFSQTKVDDFIEKLLSAK